MSGAMPSFRINRTLSSPASAPGSGMTASFLSLNEILSMVELDRFDRRPRSLLSSDWIISIVELDRVYRRMTSFSIVDSSALLSSNQIFSIVESDLSYRRIGSFLSAKHILFYHRLERSSIFELDRFYRRIRSFSIVGSDLFYRPLKPSSVVESDLFYRRIDACDFHYSSYIFVAFSRFVLLCVLVNQIIILSIFQEDIAANRAVDDFIKKQRLHR
jgi:hypothetical protein